MAYLIAWSIHTNGPYSAWFISHVIVDIQDLVMSFVSYNFSLISRCRNSTAYSATKFCFASNDSLIFTLANLPPCLVDVCKDMSPFVSHFFKLMNCSLSKKKYGIWHIRGHV